MKYSLLCLSGQSQNDLAGAIRAVRAGTRPRWSAHESFRLSVVYAGATDLTAKLDAASAQLENTSTSPASDDLSGVYYDGRPAVNAPVAFLYPGQGSQYAGRLYGFRQALPGSEENLRKLDQIWRELAGESLIDVIYGQSDDHLRDTRFAQ